MGSFVRALLSLRGRLRRAQFWLAWLLVFVGEAYSSQEQSVASTTVGLITLYVALCVYGKRLHDFDKTAWYMIIPIGATFGTYAYLAAELSRVNASSIQQLGEKFQVAGSRHPCPFTHLSPCPPARKRASIVTEFTAN